MTSYVPNVAAQTTEASDRRQIVLLMLLAFSVQTLGHLERGRQGKRFRSEDIVKAIRTNNLFAWAVLSAILLTLSDFQSITQLTKAFAGLIAIAVTISSGEPAAKAIERIAENGISGKPTRQKAKDKTNG